ncbi:MAG TPA: nitrite reductase small subunit NirD [Hyphomonadaceae bacterium]|jgi:nitrite reductase (NADH) small subunit|nr:nitrite reductase small subunit NirD [Hyphomonadaceae bacterium]
MTAMIVERLWLDVCALEDIPQRGARRIGAATKPVAIFRTGEDEVYALVDRCPHRQGPLSMGIVHGSAVTCPLHGMKIDLATGEPMGADAGKGCAPRIDVKLERGRVLIDASAIAQ